MHAGPRRQRYDAGATRVKSFGGDRAATTEERARVTASLEKRGYTNVHEIEVDDGRFEADATAPAGHDVDLELDMRSLEIVHEHRD